jgi:hypothetical protein
LFIVNNAKNPGIKMKVLSIAVLALFTNLVAEAQTRSADRGKRSYSLFYPTPKDQMRDMETDRPDVTESAYSVDAGHFQVESDAIRFSRIKTDGLNITQTSYNIANLKVGLSNSVDLQLVVPFYQQEKIRYSNGSQVRSSTGLNDFTLRIKKNVWGNDGGGTALAIMPFINVMAGKHAEDKRPEGGVVIPFAVDLKNEWSLGAQGQFSFLRSELKGYDGEILNSLTVGKALSQTSSSFIESHYTYNLQSRDFELFFNGGYVYSFTENLKVDVGFNYGLSKGSEKAIFIGYSFRY